MSNRVEHQKLNQVGAGRPPPGWVFGVQLGLRQTQALIKTKNIRRRKVPPAILLLCRKHYYFVVKLLQSSNITSGTLPLLIFLVLISACVCRSLGWTQETQSLLPPGWGFGFQLGLRQTDERIKTKKIRRGKVPPAILLLCRKHYYFVLKLQHSSNITDGTFPLLVFLVLTSAYVCRRQS